MRRAEEQREEKYLRMTTAPLYPLLWQMAVPSMVGMAVASVYSMTDTFFVGKLDRTELTAAVGIVFSFISIIQAIGFWFGYGSGNALSRHAGEKNFDRAEEMAAAGFDLAVLVGVLIAVLGLVWMRPLAALLGAGTSTAVFTAVLSYLRITLIGVPLMLVSNVLYNQLRLQGSGRDSMLGLLAGMVLNMALDPVLILGLHMEVAGAALASLIGQACGVAILWRQTARNGNIPVRPLRWKPKLSLVGAILAGGAPNFCRQGISSVSAVILNHAAGAFGEAVLAGLTVALRVLSMGYALVIGFGQGFQPICLINYGAGRHRRIKKAFLCALGTATGFLILGNAVMGFGSRGIAAAFSTDDAVIRAASDFLRAFSTVLPFMGYYILIGMLMQNIGRFGQATLITTMENGLFLIPLALALPPVFGYPGLLWCKPAASLCALLCSLLIGTRAWRRYLKEEQGGA
ncbi:MAG: MATE family efflux transporter [Oscillospiraceae bacterium]|nr:MATE family efflux transporter [Oscillospiraceae bacterium]